MTTIRAGLSKPARASISYRLISSGAVAGRQNAVRLQFQGRVQVREAARKILGVQAQHAPIVPGHHQGRIRGQGGVVVGARLFRGRPVELPDLPSPPQGDGVVRLGFQHDLEIREGRVVAVHHRAGLAASQTGGQIVRPDAQGRVGVRLRLGEAVDIVQRPRARHP